MFKTFLLTASLFYASLSLGATTLFTFHQGYRLTQQEVDHLKSYVGEEGVASIESALKDKSIISISLEFENSSSSMEDLSDPRPERPEPRPSNNCRVRVTRTTDGGGSARVDGKVVGGEINGNGKTTESWDVETPCDRVGDVIDKIKK